MENLARFSDFTIRLLKSNGKNNYWVIFVKQMFPILLLITNLLSIITVLSHPFSLIFFSFFILVYFVRRNSGACGWIAISADGAWDMNYCGNEEGALWKECESKICAVKRTQKCNKNNKECVNEKSLTERRS